MERFLSQPIDVHTISPLSLAFIGDGVYELLVREMLLGGANRKNGQLHKLSVSHVCAEAQAAAMQTIMPHLTDAELAVYKRGRNAHTARNEAAYHAATGLEALFGYLYLDGRIDRVRELFRIIVEGKDETNTSETQENQTETV